MRVRSIWQVGAAIGTLAQTSVAMADLRVVFLESAPKDRFIIENLGDCPLSAPSLTIDLAPAGTGLIFDPTTSGPGVNVAQPFVIEEGKALLASASPVRDGDVRIELNFHVLAPGDRFVFSIDLDDSQEAGPYGPTQIGPGEMLGATASLSWGNGTTASAAFDGNAWALVGTGRCLAS